MKENILIIGACGQLGTELLTALRAQHGDARVIAADIRPSTPELQSSGPYEQLDVLNRSALSAVIARHNVTQIYLLAAMLSATGEQKPQQAWQLNMHGLLHTLDLAQEKKIRRVFCPSSIAVFGPGVEAQFCPQHAQLRPTTVYGISKAAGENWCAYYHEKYGVDVRSLRYPGLISHQAQPGGGTTDYAVDIFHHAVANQTYNCYLRADTRLPMMYMPDAIRATLELMEAPASAISIRTSYNLAAMSFTPEEVAREIRQHYPKFETRFAPDWRQVIADSWPQRIDDTLARRDWKWDEQYDLSAMTRDMLPHLAAAKKQASAPAHAAAPVHIQPPKPANPPTQTKPTKSTGHTRERLI